MKTGYIGAGVMGCGIVKNLRQKGFDVSFVVHQNRERVDELTGCGAVEVPGYAALAGASDVIMMTVPDSSVVEPLLLEDQGIGPHLKEGQIVIDLSTSHPDSTRKIAEILETRGIVLLDAPVTGSRPEAESGNLNVMCGGPEEAYKKVKPLFDAIAANVFHVGPAGSGNVIKLINNFLGQMGVAATCEIVPLAKKYGVDLKGLQDVVTVSGGASKSFLGLYPRLLENDFGLRFAQKYVHKDLRYVNEMANAADLPAPMASALYELHGKVKDAGFGDEDFAAVLKYLEQPGE